MSWASPYRTPLPGSLNRDPSSLALLCTGTPSPSHAPLLVTSGAQDQRLIQSCSLEDPLLLVTSSGQDWGPFKLIHFRTPLCWHLVAGYWSMYGGWAGSTHIIVQALLCLAYFSFMLNIFFIIFVQKCSAMLCSAYTFSTDWSTVPHYQHFYHISISVGLWFPATEPFLRQLRRHYVPLVCWIGLVSNQYFPITCTHHPTPVPPNRPICVAHGYFQQILCQFCILSTE